MRRIFVLVLLSVSMWGYAAAQTNPTDTPATKEDVENYFKLVHTKESASKVAEAMLKPLRQMIHERYLRDKAKYPADCEERTNKHLDEMMASMPWDEMIAATVPVYQKHLTKGDVDTMVAFYETPTGQKLLKELPEILSESMQAMMPLLRKQIDSMNHKVEEQMEAMKRETEGKNAPQINN